MVLQPVFDPPWVSFILRQLVAAGKVEMPVDLAVLFAMFTPLLN